MNREFRIVFDFDGTFTSVEALDELALILLKNEKDENNKNQIIEKIKAITAKGMSGEIDFRESLVRRIELLSIRKSDIDVLVDFLRSKISLSILKYKDFFIENSDSIMIVSGGFKEFIVPIVKDFGINSEMVYANEFTFDDNENVVGFDKENFLSMPQGKVKLFRELGFDLKDLEVIMIGDGYTDYELKKEGLVFKFYAFTENYRRENVVEGADCELKKFDDFFEVFNE